MPFCPSVASSIISIVVIVSVCSTQEPRKIFLNCSSFLFAAGGSFPVSTIITWDWMAFCLPSKLDLSLHVSPLFPFTGLFQPSSFGSVILPESISYFSVDSEYKWKNTIICQLFQNSTTIEIMPTCYAYVIVYHR